MFIYTTEVTMHRGDSLKLSFDVFLGDSLTKSLYNISEEDNIYFAILEPNQPWEAAIVKKKLSVAQDSKINVTIEPKDTMCLLPGLYYFQLKLRNRAGEVYTLNPRERFYIFE